MASTDYRAHGAPRFAAHLTRHIAALAVWVWAVVAALIVVTTIVATVRAFSVVATPCAADERCASPQLFPAHAAFLATYGVGPVSYALLMVGLWSLITLGGVLVGGVIVWHARGDRSALLGAYTLLLYGIANTPLQILGGGSAWGGPVAAATAWIVGDAALIYFCALFPTGQFVPRPLRWVLPALLGLDAALAVYTYTVPMTFDSTLMVYGGIIGWMAILVGAQLYRYRYASTAIERQQTQAIVIALILCLFVRHCANLAALVLLHGADPAAFFSLRLLVRLLDSGLNMLLPLLVGVAILRHRLYNIDVVINRAVVYVLLTGCVVGLYVLFVGGMSILLHSDDNLLISLLATGTIAMLFQSLRARLQRTVNRLLYGERDDPYAVLARLGQQLQATVSADAVLSSVVGTVRDALRLPYVALALRKDAELVLTATSGAAPATAPLAIPLRYQHVEIGRLLLGRRGPNDPFTPTDERLLHDLARHIGIAAHAMQLADDLQRSRERLVTAREEERRRLRRDLHDGLGPTLASLTMQVDTARALVDCDPVAVTELLAQVQTEMKSSIATVRQLVYALRPPALDQLGLRAAIHEHATRTLAAHGIGLDIDFPPVLPALPAAVEVAAYYIVVEATTNIVRHAAAQRCTIALALTATALELDIADDGAGMPDTRHVGVGLAAMRERAEELGGTCLITSHLNIGTRIHVSLRTGLECAETAQARHHRATSALSTDQP